MLITCIIVEDEPLALERTRGYVSKLPYLNLVATFNNGLDALVYLKSNAVDLMFLDIHMGEFSGIQLLESGPIHSEIILTTAFSEYAIKGFDLKVTDYLLKPFSLERFIQAVDKVREKLIQKTGKPELEFLFIKTEYRLEKVLLSSIVYIEGMRDYRRIHTTDKKIMTLQTFKEFEQLIPETMICRVHKSFMVSLSKIDSVEGDRIRIKELYIPVSDTYRKIFFSLIGKG
ncbi:MAG TPA: LytTR family DNA-binding domain-containing protein [Bacteroidia bacterium]|jgi:two-component system LytT family response regulator|nr:LytTR family DNA-binding domain-containing protein [Bacteroidia bacterium]